MLNRSLFTRKFGHGMQEHLLHMGINLGHDRSVAIVQGGKVVIAIEQERLDRCKHSVGLSAQAPHALEQMQLPHESIRYCLDALEIELNDLATITANMPGRDHGPAIVRRQLPRDLSERVCAVPTHHLAHAYSAYWPSGFEDALVLVADGSGSVLPDAQGHWKTESYSIYAARNGRLEPVHFERVPAHLAGLSTLGFVYENVARKAGFETRLSNSIRFAEAGKLMGLAAYGEPQQHWHRWLRPVDGQPRVTVPAYDVFLEIAALEKRYDSGVGKPYFRPWLVDLAAKVQQELEDSLCHIVTEAMRETGLTRLCMAGGVALNSVANYRILQSCGLEDIFVFPAAADNGIAAGCALWAYAEVEEGRSRPELHIATLGRSPHADDVDAALETWSDDITVEHLERSAMLEVVSEALAAGSIVARFEGGCEYGPRALGHRSILADPTFPRMKDVINARVKFREAFRPFAPFIPLERASEVFALGTRSPFMLLVADIHPEFQSLLPSITHADGTGRVQTCTEQANPFFTALCESVANKRGGPPVLLNTSFNVAGQPIVETPEEAIATFLRTDIDYLALEGCWIRRKSVPVKTYAEHASGLVHEDLPKGLPSGAEAVTDLMKELDAALFLGKESRHWSQEELAGLSQRGGRYKETSERFVEHGYIAPLQTDFGARAVLLLNPRGVSTLADPLGEQPALPLTRDRVELLLAMVQPAERYQSALRVALQLSHRELREAVQALNRVIARFGLLPRLDWATESRVTDAPLPPVVAQTLAPFADAEFQIRNCLASFAEALTGHGYEESTIIDLLGVESLQQIEPTHLYWHANFQLPLSPLADLIRLFLLRAALAPARINELLGTSVADALRAIGLLKESGQTERSRVDLFCSGGMFFATDHRAMLHPEDAIEEDPVMYIGMDSHGLVQTAPRGACDRLLDLCCGSGVQGLVASRYAHQVVAVDLNPRAVRFTRFNAQLNGVENHEVRLGSLYEPVAGERFDVVLANPPFVPSPEASIAFRDGGARGERILQQIVEGASAHTTSAARVVIVTDLVDVDTYPERLRQWWSEDDFDALVLTTANRDEILFSAPHCHAPFNQSFAEYNQELGQWLRNFRGAGIEHVNFGYLALWRHAPSPDSYIVSRVIHNPSTPIHHELDDWRAQRSRWNASDAADLFLCLHPGARLRCEVGPGGGAPKHEVGVPSSAFFTTYTLPSQVYEALVYIGNTNPRRGEFIDGVGTWVHDLHTIGVLRLETSPPRIRDESSDSEPDGIIEQATKTTPTCLTSYLG